MDMEVTFLENRIYVAFFNVSMTRLLSNGYRLKPSFSNLSQSGLFYEIKNSNLMSGWSSLTLLYRYSPLSPALSKESHITRRIWDSFQFSLFGPYSWFNLSLNGMPYTSLYLLAKIGTISLSDLHIPLACNPLMFNLLGLLAPIYGDGTILNPFNRHNIEYTKSSWLVSINSGHISFSQPLSIFFWMIEDGHMVLYFMSNKGMLRWVLGLIPPPDMAKWQLRSLNSLTRVYRRIGCTSMSSSMRTIMSSSSRN